MKVVRLSALSIGRLYPRKHSWYSFLLEVELIPGPYCGRKYYVDEKKSNDTIGDRTRDLPACSAVPQPTAPPRAPPVITNHLKMFKHTNQTTSQPTNLHSKGQSTFWKPNTPPPSQETSPHYGTRMFITTLTIASHLSSSYATLFHSTTSKLI